MMQNNEFNPLGFYIVSMYEKTANDKVSANSLIIDSYNNGLEAALAAHAGDSVKVAREEQAKTASQALGREIFFDFASRLFLNK